MSAEDQFALCPQEALKEFHDIICFRRHLPISMPISTSLGWQFCRIQYVFMHTWIDFFDALDIANRIVPSLGSTLVMLNNDFMIVVDASQSTIRIPKASSG